MATIGALVGVGVGPAARAASFGPSYFPTGVALDGNAYSLQFSGANREGTAAAIALDMALGSNPSQGYPFSTTTMEPKTDPTLLYGPGTCPTTAVLVADDTPADALAAAALRGFKTLPVTDGAGQNVTFNTTATVLLLTESGRSGATALDATTAAALGKIIGKCHAIPGGIVLGGTAAVPDSVASQFGALVGDVARIAGADRFATAADVAVAAASGGLPTVTDYPTASSPTGTGTALDKALFLAEGQTGADALAVGPVAASGVPILLTDTGTLPDATQGAITRLAPKNIIVLGGTAAVSDTVVSEAATASGSGTKVTRIAGKTRYATSVDIAEQLMNLYASYAGSSPNFYSDQLVGVARDEGTSAAGNYVGWPDALASAYYLAELTAAKAVNPKRLAPPVESSDVNGGSATVIAPSGACSGSNCIPRYPLLLTTGAKLAPEIDSYLTTMFPSGNTYTTPGAMAPSTDDGGFAFIFGGTAAVSGTDQLAVAKDLSGGTYAGSATTDVAPVLGSPPFYTTVDLTPFTASMPGVTQTFSNGSNGHPKACVMPSTKTAGVAGLLGIAQDGSTPANATGATQYFGGMGPYPAGAALGSCVDLDYEAGLVGTADTTTVYGASLSGHETPATSLDFADQHALLSGVPGQLGKPTGDFSNNTNSGDVFGPGASGTETLTYSPSTSSISGGVAFRYQGTTYSDSCSTGGGGCSGPALGLVLHLTRSSGANGQDYVTWSGTLSGYASPTTATPIWTVTVTGGVADETTLTGAPMFNTMNLVGEYSTGTATGTGAVVMQVKPSQPPGTSAPTVSGLVVSGLT